MYQWKGCGEREKRSNASRSWQYKVLISTIMK